jgi:hypothetical protein
MLLGSLNKGYAAVRLECPTFSSERAARLKTTQARKARERKRRQVADKELSASVVLVCACDGGCRISEDERWGRCLCRVCDGKDTKFTGKKCAAQRGKTQERSTQRNNLKSTSPLG